MVKYSIELFQVHRSFKVKFCVVVESDPDPRWGNSNQVISNSLFYNNRYLSMRPHPFLTFDITNRIERNEEWSSNRTFNMNRRERFTMCKKLSSFIEVFEDEKDLFYFEDDELKVNKQLADDKKLTIVCCQKTIQMIPCVVDNEEDHLQYEGAVMVINSIDYFTYITYTELQYLLFELRNVDFNVLTTEAFIYMELVKDEKPVQINFNKSPIVEQQQNDIIDTKQLIQKEDNAIPEI